jgi:hypothetical protein
MKAQIITLSDTPKYASLWLITGTVEGHNGQSEGGWISLPVLVLPSEADAIEWIKRTEDWIARNATMGDNDNEFPDCPSDPELAGACNHYSYLERVSYMLREIPSYQSLEDFKWDD